MSNLCPACESGTLVARVGDRSIFFNGSLIAVRNLHYSECSNCGEGVVLPAQAKRNEVIYSDAKKAAMGLWSCGRIEAFRKKWGIRQQDAALLFGGGVNAFSKYERGEVIHSKSMDLLMRAFDESEETRELLCRVSGVRPAALPYWESVHYGSGVAPRRRANATDVVRQIGNLKVAANGDPWETEAIHAP